MGLFLVTGGAGFIGSHLVEALLVRGKRVRVLDNFFSGDHGRIARWAADIELIEGDLRDTSAVARAVAGVDVILHHAAVPSVQRSVRDPQTTNEVNVTGTLNLLLAARDAGVKRLVFASSSSVYGDTPTLPKIETMPTDPLSPYAVSKLAGERYCMVFSSIYGLPAIALRYFNVFGPRQDPHSDYAAVIPRFITSMLRGASPMIYGDGLQSRDFTYVANVVAANLLAAEAAPHISGTFNVAGGERITLLDLVAQLNTLLGSTITPLHEAARAGDVKHSQAAISSIHATLGFAPVVPFAEGLKLTVESFR